MSKWTTAKEYLKPTEVMWAMGGVFLFMLVITLIAYWRQSDTEKFSLTYEHKAQKAEQKKREVSKIETAVEQEPLVRQTERVKEASSIALGLTLYVLSQRVSHGRIVMFENLMSEFAQSDLFPPGVENLEPTTKTDYGLLKTSKGFYYVRYRSTPLTIEILSSGIEGLADGATFVLRVPDSAGVEIQGTSSTVATDGQVQSVGQWATVYSSPMSANHGIPKAFAGTSVYQQMNWLIEPVYQVEFSATKTVELNKLLATMSR